MKKMLSILVVLSILLSVSVAFAEDLGVQMIGDNNAEMVPVSLDDLKIGNFYTVDGYAVIAPKEMKIVDSFAQFGEKGDYSVYNNSHNYYPAVFCHSQSNLDYYSWRYSDAAWMNSGESADFVWLLMDVTNLQKTEVEFTEDISVKVVYRDEYEFVGWVRQIVYDHMEAQNGDRGVSRYEYAKEAHPNEIVMNPAKVEPIGMMYTGTYAFGCTLPNYVVEDTKAPLRIEIQLGENELTYHIHK